MPMRSFPARFAIVWVGMTTGSIIGMALFWSSLLFFGFHEPEGWVLAAGGAGVGAIAGVLMPKGTGEAHPKTESASAQ